ncbi:hypothetical protein PUN28_019538 [Cardiocondyla obscurior]|uniref:Uncharacterized protein n=1 Tax=Cardiocondyla obscurior TaxID=286306 RepID=A0AAW2E903_9HYME
MVLLIMRASCIIYKVLSIEFWHLQRSSFPEDIIPHILKDRISRRYRKLYSYDNLHQKSHSTHLDTSLSLFLFHLSSHSIFKTVALLPVLSQVIAIHRHYANCYMKNECSVSFDQVNDNDNQTLLLNFYAKSKLYILRFINLLLVADSVSHSHKSPPSFFFF